MKGRKKLAK